MQLIKLMIYIALNLGSPSQLLNSFRPQGLQFYFYALVHPTVHNQNLRVGLDLKSLSTLSLIPLPLYLQSFEGSNEISFVKQSILKGKYTIRVYNV